MEALHVHTIPDPKLPLDFNIAACELEFCRVSPLALGIILNCTVSPQKFYKENVGTSFPCELC